MKSNRSPNLRKDKSLQWSWRQVRSVGMILTFTVYSRTSDVTTVAVLASSADVKRLGCIVPE